MRTLALLPKQPDDLGQGQGQVDDVPVILSLPRKKSGDHKNKKSRQVYDGNSLGTHSRKAQPD